MKTKTNKKITKKALPTMESELKKAIKEPKKAKKQAEKKKDEIAYVYYVTFVDRNNKLNGEMLPLTRKIDTPFDVEMLKYSVDVKQGGNFKCLLDWKFITELKNETIVESIEKTADAIKIGQVKLCK